jgi:hypothetical protein
MYTASFAELRAFHVDGGWYHAYWLSQAREHSARTLARSIVHLWKACIAAIGVRCPAAVMLAEGSPCFGDEVARARRLLLEL